MLGPKFYFVYFSDNAGFGNLLRLPDFLPVRFIGHLPEQRKVGISSRRDFALRPALH